VSWNMCNVTDEEEQNKADPPVLEKEEQYKEVDEMEKKQSLNSIGGKGLGLLQVFSLSANALLMVYAHAGLSAILESNQSLEVTPVKTTSNATGVCTDADLLIYGDGATNNDDISFCAREKPSPCLAAFECNTQCFLDEFGYSEPCAECFGGQAPCSIEFQCAFLCLASYEATECIECSKPCNERFAVCSGLPLREQTPVSDSPMATNTTESPLDACTLQKETVNYADFDEWHTVYEIKFFAAIEDAWKNDAKLLAIIVVLFSGIWPYAKNVALGLAWYLPLTPSQRMSVLVWLRRLGKYTLVDIYVVALILVGVLLEMTVGGVPVVVKGEPRLAIISFLVATLWEFIHIEWMYFYHESCLKKDSGKDNEEDETILTVWKREGSMIGYQSVMILLLACTVGLFLSGSMLDMISFTTIDTAISPEGCTRSLNLYTLPFEMISDLVMYQNSAKPGTWCLFMAYVLMVVLLPIAVHLVHTVLILFRLQSNILFEIADMSWTFASVEVLLLGVWTLQYKFEEFIAAVSGEEGAEFLTVSAELGPGFFLLLAYAVFSGLLHHYCRHPGAVLKTLGE